MFNIFLYDAFFFIPFAVLPPSSVSFRYEYGTHKASSDDPILRIRFLVSKTGNRRSDGPISRLRFCCENVESSFVVCSHDPFFRTDKESSVGAKNNHAKFVGVFHL